MEKSWTLPNAGESSPFVPERGAGWLAVGGDAVWAASPRAISRIDPATSQLRSRESSVWGPLAYGFGSVWVLSDELERVSPRTLRRIDTVDLANGFVALVAGSGAVWVANEDNGTVVRVDPAEEVVSRTYDVGGRPSGLALGAGAVWVASDAGIARIDPSTDDVRSLALGGAPRNVAVATSGVWASVD
jgi:DNA-binding beta-propeller fold protein YncE